MIEWNPVTGLLENIRVDIIRVYHLLGGEIDPNITYLLEHCLGDITHIKEVIDKKFESVTV